ncbi:DUF11 domain-containing protein [Shewanella sp. FJAT-52076]|uniref:DUF11 domain-containing protein n=1 Tax=Shewanella sp. FJAT-52076 TaxID=2864202 RepID=UPI001C66219D|nr:DUF11 domain-containing protein [Shewanella sp. FJAT-52076]QYJ76751.1 DUF11 domain-containing protein [Shewanella sp. FJAT-52076]
MKLLCKGKILRRFSALALGFTMGMAATPAFAVHDDIFELEGNAVQDAVAPPYDWATLYNNGSNNGGDPLRFTGIVDDTPDASGIDSSIFTGGRKDIQDVSDWAHKMGSSPDKDEITHAYAAAYNINDDLVVYFGADRISNKGDAFLGFWFFKQHVAALPNGSFEGMHTNGDVLVLANFPQSVNASPEIRVDVWDSSCTKAANNNPAAGECDAANLRLLYKGAAICGSGLGNDLVCAITNDENGSYDPTPSPWPYQSKNSNNANEFPYETFFEGGINLTQLVGGDSCFSSFMAETRSSSEFTATLKDFVIHDFELCSVDITKTCSQARVNATETGYEYDFTYKVINDGAGTLYNVVVTDNVANQTFNVGTLAKGAMAEGGGTFESNLNGLQNTVTVTAAGTPSGDSTISDTGGADCQSLSISPMINVTKDCNSNFVETENGVIAKVSFSGQVCNTTANNLTLINVTVTDDSGTPSDPSDDVDVLSGVTLGGGVCMPYSGDYVPKAFTSAVDKTFSDTVFAVGQLKIDGSSAFSENSATCPICPSSD